MRIVRRVQGAHWGAVGLTGALVIGWSVVFGAAAGTAAAADVNPLADYQGFNVVTFGDLTINAESEGALAVGGNLTWHGTNAAFKGNTDPALLVGGHLDLANSTGQLHINSTGSLKIGDLTGADVLNTDGNGASVNTEIVATGAGYNSAPAVALTHQQTLSTVSAPGLFAQTFAQSAAQQAADDVAADASTACNPDAAITPPVTAGSAAATLHTGVNYWNISAAELSAISEIVFTGPVTPSTDNPLIISVSGAGPVTLKLTMAGNRDPRGILFDMPAVTSITQSGDSIDGSILAPQASYNKTSANLQGTLIAATANLAGSEEHYYPFAGYVTSTCTTATATTPITTTEATTSAETTSTETTASSSTATTTSTTTTEATTPAETTTPSETTASSTSTTEATTSAETVTPTETTSTTTTADTSPANAPAVTSSSTMPATSTSPTVATSSGTVKTAGTTPTLATSSSVTKPAISGASTTNPATPSATSFSPVEASSTRISTSASKTTTVVAVQGISRAATPNVATQPLAYTGAPLRSVALTAAGLLIAGLALIAPRRRRAVRKH